MKRQGKTIISTKIEVNKDKIYRTQDIHDLSYLIFPNKNAKDLRGAFILIFLSIKYSLGKKLTTPDLNDLRIQKSLDISQKTLWKARAVMARIGIIECRDGIYWQFSSRFGKSLKNLAEKVDQVMVPIGNTELEEKEWHLLLYR
ncbi:hypothetical protein [Desulfobacula sp.]|uniref:hypothetical protein n=1 Tax=Desulfobacula sp. TaxID=2593537 RepID=UPI001ED6FB51|nr:hypothetical protein [Desulfobacula sp.]